MMTERDRKKAAKAEKKAAKEAAEREKEAKIQKGLIEVFNDKQAKAGKESDAVAKLKQWLLNPPYKSTNRDMKVSRHQTKSPTERDFLLGDAVLAAGEQLVVGNAVQRW